MNIEEIIKELNKRWYLWDYKNKAYTTVGEDVNDFIREALEKQREEYEKEMAEKLNGYALWLKEALEKQREEFIKGLEEITKNHTPFRQMLVSLINRLKQ